MSTYDPSQFDPRRRRSMTPGESLRVPVTAVVCLVALLVTAAWHLGFNIRPLFLTEYFWYNEPWQPITSIFPHVDIPHLVFNIYWVWIFGTRVEQVYGSLRTAGLYVFLAVISSCAEFAFAAGGVGLSGVGYGLFGFLFILRRDRQIFAEVMGPGTIRMFVGWFFLCIILTALNLFPVANIAHGVGALAGMSIGYAVLQDGFRRKNVAALLAFSFVLTVLAASIFRPYVNFIGAAYIDLAIRGYEAQTSGDLAAAERYYKESIKINEANGDAWYRLGSVYHAMGGREKEAADTYFKAWELDPSAEKHGNVAFRMNAYVGQLAGAKKDYATAVIYLERATRIESDPKIWGYYAIVLHELGRTDEEKKARKNAAHATVQ